MKLELNVRYVVTHPSDDETFRVGDTVRLQKDGSLFCVPAKSTETRLIGSAYCRTRPRPPTRCTAGVGLNELLYDTQEE